MRTNITEITVKVRIAPNDDRKHENILANASLTLRDEELGYFTITGFTVWKSKHDGLNVTVPQNRQFKYLRFETGLWTRVKKMIIDAYEEEKIPVIG